MVLWISFVRIMRIMSQPEVVSERITFVARSLIDSDGKEN